ncbi:MAG: hypothetical protein ACETWD_06070 [Desulfatiglandales bacterium]
MPKFNQGVTDEDRIDQSKQPNECRKCSLPSKGPAFVEGKGILPPLNLCMVAAYTPMDVEVSITDECVKPIDFQKTVDLVGITAYTNAAPRAYEIADAFHRRGIPGSCAASMHRISLKKR